MCVYTLYIATKDSVTIMFKYYIHCFLKKKKKKKVIYSLINQEF